jgi:hypothetical protein
MSNASQSDRATVHCKHPGAAQTLLQSISNPELGLQRHHQQYHRGARMQPGVSAWNLCWMVIAAVPAGGAGHGASWFWPMLAASCSVIAKSNFIDEPMLRSACTQRRTESGHHESFQILPQGAQFPVKKVQHQYNGSQDDHPHNSNSMFRVAEVSPRLQPQQLLHAYQHQRSLPASGCG